MQVTTGKMIAETTASGKSDSLDQSIVSYNRILEDTNVQEYLQNRLCADNSMVRIMMRMFTSTDDLRT